MADDGLPWVFWTIDLRQVIHSLGEITGEELTESVLERIFSRFCIGKRAAEILALPALIA